jgi:hypothetical protein
MTNNSICNAIMRTHELARNRFREFESLRRVDAQKFKKLLNGVHIKTIKYHVLPSFHNIGVF